MSKEDKDDNVVFIEDESEGTIVDLSGNSTVKEEPVKDDRLSRAEAELSELRTQLQQTRQQDFGQQQPQPVFQSSGDEPSDEVLAERERALGIQWEADKAAGRLREQPGLVEQYDKKAREIKSAYARNATRREVAAMMPQMLQMQQAQMFRQQHADVYSSTVATTWAKGAYHQLLAEGYPDTPETVNRAMDRARIKFNMPGAKNMKPTDRDREQLSGIGGSNGRPAVDNTVRMGKAEKSMAMAMYGEAFNGDEKKVYAQWAKGPGLRAKKAYAKSQRS